MGQVISFGLSQDDVEELINLSGNVFSQAEIEGLYRRFRSLDKGHKGYVSAEEFLSIPELSINPLARRLDRMFDSINFMEFVVALAPFSRRATRQQKLALLFALHDVDGNGVITADDLELIVRQLAGATLSDDLVGSVVRRALSEAGREGSGLLPADLEAVLQNCDLTMEVDIK